MLDTVISLLILLPAQVYTGWRYLPVVLVSQVPYVGGVLGLLNIGFIFRQDRRCVHDHLAGTRVVEVVKPTS